MAQLIQMRQRIKAIQTIKKVTHAMRLISMSAHTRLQGQRSTLNYYHHEAAELLKRIGSMADSNNKKIKNNEISDKKKAPLIILIGSQKGLCGSFNSSLFSRLELFIKKKLQNKKFEVVVIGKQAADALKARRSQSIIYTYDELTSDNLSTLADAITKNILSSNGFGTRPVWVVSNILKNFFSPQPVVTQILPMADQQNKHTQEPIEPFITEQPLDQILDYIKQEYLYSTAHHLLFESLTAEQAARFVSMDNATRNAQNLLETTRHEYNKLRQAKITSELAELTSNI